MTSPMRRLELARAQEALRQREREAGLVRKTVTIPAERVEELAEIVRRWKMEQHTHPNVAGG